ncbi:hypothetical protein H5410_047387 [Solanum commersonii]|uniref:Uncharacterized protein n=1 Tax=Solanum commersonii TaxID=4109 RepID=A0A9J5XEZ5_SOLCO|nr:hypothetical protein H5410_047387 [Solanum commersonii]
MTSKFQRNEDGGQKREQEVQKDTAKKRDRSKLRESSSNPPVCGRILGEEGEVFDTSQIDEKITGVEAGFLALNRRLVVFKNNFSSLEIVVLEGLAEVKSNLVELKEVNKKGLTNLELKLTEALSSLHKEFETLKRQVDKIVSVGVAGPVTVCETRGKAGVADKGKNVVVGMFNHMALFNHMTFAALAAQPTSVRPRESLFVNAKLNGKDIRIMVDIGATHNFVMKKRANDLCLNYVANDTMLKTINSLPTTVHGFTPKVLIDLGG